MKRKLSVLALLLCCLLVLTGCCSHEWYAATCEAPKTCAKCGETEGEALSHTWVDATCEAPKTCSACHVTEGEALGHSWVDATTEAPKTCTICAATEGERIITDPRFTTTATKDLYGKWVANVELPLTNFGYTGYDTVVLAQTTMEMDREGTIFIHHTVANTDEINASICEYTENTLYQQYAAQGVSKEAVNATAMSQYGMSFSEYVADYIEKNGLATVIEAMEYTGVYYVDGNLICMSSQWEGEMSENEFTLDGDTLTFTDDIIGLSEPPAVFQRSAE